MKDWKMPQIRVEAFTANEYVAACRQMASGLSGNMYWDVFESGMEIVFYPPFIIPYTRFNGDGDKEYNSPYEDIGSTTGGNFTVNEDVPTGWVTTELWTNRYPRDGQNYSRNFRNLGSFKIYVFESGKAWIYGPEMDTTKTPSLSKNFS